MIKFFDDSNKIIPLWQEAFGDSKEDILFFLKNCKKKTALGANIFMPLALIKISAVKGICQTY